MIIFQLTNNLKVGNMSLMTTLFLQDSVGTSLFFRASENHEPVDPVFGHRIQTKVDYLDATRKKLKLKRVFLKNKPAEELVAAAANSNAAAPLSNQKTSES